MIAFLEKIDQQLFLFLNGIHTPWLDPVFYLISYKLTWIPLYLIILIFAYRKKGMNFALFILLGTIVTVALADLISVHAFKNVFERYRPSHNKDFGHLVHVVRDFSGQEIRGGYFGFVSSHAANHFGIAVFAGLMMRPIRKRILLFLLLWAAIITYSRIYMGVHYPADVFVGGLLGAFIGFLIYKLSILINNRFSIFTP